MTGSEWFDKLSEAILIVFLKSSRFDILEKALFVDDILMEFSASRESSPQPPYDHIKSVIRRAFEFKEEIETQCASANATLGNIMYFSPDLPSFTNDSSYHNCVEKILILNNIVKEGIDTQYPIIARALADPSYASALAACRSSYIQLKTAILTIKKIVANYNSHHIKDGLSLPDVVLPKLIWPRFSFIRSLLMFYEVDMTDSDKKWFDALTLAVRYATSAILDFVGFEAELAMADMFTSEFTSSSKTPSPMDVDRIHEVTAKTVDFRIEMERHCDKVRVILAGVSRLAPTLHNFTDDISYKRCASQVSVLIPLVNSANLLYENVMQVLEDQEYVHSREAFKMASTYFISLVTAIKNAADDYSSHHKTDGLSLSDVVLPKW